MEINVTEIVKLDDGSALITAELDEEALKIFASIGLETIWKDSAAKVLDYTKKGAKLASSLKSKSRKKNVSKKRSA